MSSDTRTALNPVECIWGYLKRHALADFCIHDFAQLSEAVQRKLRSMQRRPTPVTAFWKKAGIGAVVVNHSAQRAPPPRLRIGLQLVPFISLGCHVRFPNHARFQSKRLSSIVVILNN